jgi:PhnB protein
MASRLNPYLIFKDNAAQAMEFYAAALGGKLTKMTFRESGVDADGIMHASLVTDDGMYLMASDMRPDMRPAGEYKREANISMSLSGEDESRLRGCWDKLAEGAKIEMPLEQAPWGDTFGMLTDKFGIDWMVNITAKKS